MPSRQKSIVGIKRRVQKIESVKLPHDHRVQQVCLGHGVIRMCRCNLLESRDRTVIIQYIKVPVGLAHLRIVVQRIGGYTVCIRSLACAAGRRQQYQSRRPCKNPSSISDQRDTPGSSRLGPISSNHHVSLSASRPVAAAICLQSKLNRRTGAVEDPRCFHWGYLISFTLPSVILTRHTGAGYFGLVHLKHFCGPLDSNLAAHFSGDVFRFRRFRMTREALLRILLSQAKKQRLRVPKVVCRVHPARPGPEPTKHSRFSAKARDSTHSSSPTPLLATSGNKARR